MTDQELESKARELLDRVLRDGPAERRLVKRDMSVVNAGAEADARRISDHYFSVLGAGADVTVFLDPAGNVAGWRDDGRKGTMIALQANRSALLKAVAQELGLGPEARLGEVKSVVLDPAGWTFEAVVFTKPVPEPTDVLRVWVDPEHLKIIQCLYRGAR